MTKMKCKDEHFLWVHISYIVPRTVPLLLSNHPRIHAIRFQQHVILHNCHMVLCTRDMVPRYFAQHYLKAIM